MAKKYFYPLRDPENPNKVTLVPITEDQYRSLYPEIWATQKREQYHGRCMCPKHYLKTSYKETITGESREIDRGSLAAYPLDFMAFESVSELEVQNG